MERKSTFGYRDTKLLARLERKKIRGENHKRRQDQAKEEKEMLIMVLGGKKAMGQLRNKRVKISVSLLLSNGRIRTGYRCTCHGILHQRRRW